MNGHQAYLKRMEKQIALEIQSSKIINYKLGIKLVKGAALIVEKKQGDGKHIWESFEGTHQAYQRISNMLIESMQDGDCFMMATHNPECIENAKLALKKSKINH